MRKIIQIAFSTTGWIGDTNDFGSEYQVGGSIDSKLYALCNDGTILFFSNSDQEWKISEKNKPIPQDAA